MKKTLLAVLATLPAAAAFAGPLNLQPLLNKAYVGAMGSYVSTDNARPEKYGKGVQFVAGVPFNDNISLEATLFAHLLERTDDSKNDLSHGLGLDLMFRQASTDQAFFLLLGGGAIREDITHIENVAPYLNFGVGALGKLPFSGVLSKLSWRVEAREVLNYNDKGAPGTGVESFTEPRINLGLTYGFNYAAEEVAAVEADSDADGVTDTADLCPGTPPGSVVDASGCPAATGDADGDGVVDTLDQCPGTEAGVTVDATGCPVPAAAVNPDEDGDGVPNEADKCPNTPASFKVDPVGCLVEQTVALQSINFEFDSDALTASAKTILDGMAKSLAVQTEVKVVITGHTDSLGPQSYNLTLSQKRAKAVKTYLIGAGVAADRLSSEGEGEFNPIADNNSEAGRANNRRVEFKIAK